MRAVLRWARRADALTAVGRPVLHPSQWLTSIALTTLVTGVVLVAGATTMLLREREAAAAQRELRRAEDVMHAVELAVADQLSILRGLQGFVAAEGSPTAEGFARYVEHAGVFRVSGLQAVEWAAAPDGSVDTVVIELVETSGSAGSLNRIVGTNLADDPVRRTVIEESISTRQPRFSPEVDLLGQSSPATGLVVYQAVFDDERFAGIVGIVVEPGAMLADAARLGNDDIDFSISDLGVEGALTDPDPLFESDPGRELNGARHRVVVNGRIWEVKAADTRSGPLGGHGGELLVGLAGLIAVAFVSFTIGLLQRWGELAERRAAELNADLLEANDDLEVASDRLRQGMASAEVELWERNLATGEGWSSESRTSVENATFEAFLERVHPDDRHLVGNDSDRLAPGVVSDVEFRLLVGDDYRWTLSRRIRTTRDGQPIVMGAQFDISERRAHLDEVEQLNLRLQSSNQSLREFTRVASHDLRAPLRAIDALAGFLRDDLGDDLEPEIEHHLSRIEDRVERLRRLITDLLAYARADHRQDTTEAVDVRALIDDVVAGAEDRRGMPILVDADLPTVNLSPTPLATCVRNLVDNAVKYHDRPDEGVIEVRAELVGQRLRISVVDDGPGIAEEHRDQIWEPFRRLVEANADVAPGSGVGLSVIKRMAEAHDGSIHLEESLGRGSTFVLEWPVDLPTKATEASAEPVLRPLQPTT